MTEDIRDRVRAEYGKFAREKTSCCSTAQSCCSASKSCCGSSESERTHGPAPHIDEAYAASKDEIETLPKDIIGSSLGCGNPLAHAEVHEGEVVLDLGSGGGLDAMIAARKVGPKGKVYGLDMTDEMLDLARRNVARAGISNVELLKGYIESMPLPDASVDLIISNCVVNLSPDKGKVLSEAFRVLRPGGRVAISDMMFQGDVSRIPESIRANPDNWCSCVTGAMQEDQARRTLAEAGFKDISVTVAQTYDAQIEAMDIGWPKDVRLISGVIQARKPLA